MISLKTMNAHALLCRTPSEMTMLSLRRFGPSICHATFFALGLLLLSYFEHSTALGEEYSDDRVIERADPPQFGFFAKAIDCDGIFIRASAGVQDRALLTVCHGISAMLATMKVTRNNLRQRGVELHIFAKDQSLADLPENKRSLGGVVARKIANDGERGSAGIYSACGEEGLTEFAGGDGPNDCMYEFAIALMDYGFDDAVRQLILKQFQTSITSGRWRGTRAATDPQDYWAELSMRYFASNPGFRTEGSQIAPGADGLRRYDPEGFALLDLLYSGRKRPIAMEAIRARSVDKFALSHVSTRPAELQLVNNSGQRLRIFWIDPQGDLKPFGELGPYNRVIEKTFFNHVWMIEDERGVELQRFIVEDYLSEVIAAD
jgi:hypothetical protein